MKSWGVHSSGVRPLRSVEGNRRDDEDIVPYGAADVKSPLAGGGGLFITGRKLLQWGRG